VYLFRAGYDPEAALQVMNILKELKQREPGALEEFFMSHPKTSDREQVMREQVEEIKTFTEQYNRVKGNFYTERYRAYVLERLGMRS